MLTACRTNKKVIPVAEASGLDSNGIYPEELAKFSNALAKQFDGGELAGKFSAITLNRPVTKQPGDFARHVHRILRSSLENGYPPDVVFETEVVSTINMQGDTDQQMKGSHCDLFNGVGFLFEYRDPQGGVAQGLAFEEMKQSIFGSLYGAKDWLQDLAPDAGHGLGGNKSPYLRVKIPGVPVNGVERRNGVRVYVVMKAMMGVTNAVLDQKKENNLRN